MLKPPPKGRSEWLDDHEHVTQTTGAWGLITLTPVTPPCYHSINQRTVHELITYPGWPSLRFSSVQLLSCVQLFVAPWTAACQAFLSITSSWSLLKLMSIELMMPSNHLMLCSPFLLPSIFPSIRVFSSESVLCIRWPKYWSSSFSISPSSEYSGLISFRIDWLDLPAVQGTLKSLLQHHSSKASILQCSAFLIAQLSYPYMTTKKTIALKCFAETHQRV